VAAFAVRGSTPCFSAQREDCGQLSLDMCLPARLHVQYRPGWCPQVHTGSPPEGYGQAWVWDRGEGVTAAGTSYASCCLCTRHGGLVHF
jgi:hypothetical protein